MKGNLSPEELDELEAATLVVKLDKDLANAAKTMGRREARYLVDLYYQIQKRRIAAAGQVRSMAKADGDIPPEPTETLRFLGDQAFVLEGQAAKALDLWTREHPLSQWARSVVGIGPVIAAGLRAHLNEVPPPTVGHWWRFGGMDPTVVWKPKEKRPWNAKLKVVYWKAATSFVKVSGHDKDVYGKLYLARREYEAAKNEAGDYKDQAALGAARVGKDTEAYKSYSIGKLPLGHLHARAMRYAVKLFLAHYHAVAFELHFGAKPPLPYPVAFLNHAHVIPVPNWPMAK